MSGKRLDVLQWRRVVIAYRSIPASTNVAQAIYFQLDPNQEMVLQKYPSY
jgi:hypothetical protein